MNSVVPPITWHISDLNREVADGFVYRAHWEAFLYDSQYYSRTYGEVSLERHADLIPYEELAEETVIDWVKEKLGAEAVSLIEAGLIKSIEDQKHPKVSSGVPWSNDPEGGEEDLALED
jgi:hypothetical protein